MASDGPIGKKKLIGSKMGVSLRRTLVPLLSGWFSNRKSIWKPMLAPQKFKRKLGESASLEKI